ncbi:DedA family protein [Sandaracinobacteroides saxicola]|uniref:DedA family protein n=1 Tax=Sandaracinobacteroides saxicola TaxID=2759707 RepID=A0A7G5IGD3_9SPHN|nr:DedA family protein [Sandaracinobacteroides saxicola]QMW22425.1 DedA family protein [Sandaracinobacteroides saxicola]
MTDWIGTIIDNFGYVGIGLLMFVETVFPPIPSEVIMPLAGIYAAQSGHSLTGVIIAGAIGSMIGNIFWYLLAAWLGLTRFERFAIRFGRILTLDHEEIVRGQKLFERYGGAIVGVGRVLPTVRSLISIPAGLVAMDWRRFLFYSSLGTFVWTTGLAVAGYLLGKRFAEIDKVIGPLSTAIIVILFGIYLYRVITWKKTKSAP